MLKKLLYLKKKDVVNEVIFILSFYLIECNYSTLYIFFFTK